MHEHGVDIPLRHTSAGVSANLSGVDTKVPKYQHFGRLCLGYSRHGS